MTAPDVPFGHSPGPRMYGVFERTEQVDVLRHGLGAVGFLATDLKVLAGQAGSVALDPGGEGGGPGKRFLRFSQGLTDERGFISKYVHALAEGRQVVQIDMAQDDPETKERLHTAFRQAGASSIDYLGTLLNEELST